MHKNVEVRANIPTTLPGGIGITCVYSTPGADQEKDAILLNALASIAKEAKIALAMRDFNLLREDWALRMCFL